MSSCVCARFVRRECTRPSYYSYMHSLCVSEHLERYTTQIEHTTDCVAFAALIANARDVVVIIFAATSATHERVFHERVFRECMFHGV